MKNSEAAGLAEWVDKAMTLYKEGKYECAIKACGNAFTDALSPPEGMDSAIALLICGKSWFKLEEYDKAIREFNAMIGFFPSYPEALYRRGKAWYAKCEYDKAVADLNQYLEQRPNDVEARKLRDKAWKLKG